MVHHRLAVSTWWYGPRPLTRGGPKWRGNYPEGSDHPIASNRLDKGHFAVSCSNYLVK